jgi:dCMP deaminase
MSKDKGCLFCQLSDVDKNYYCDNSQCINYKKENDKKFAIKSDISLESKRKALERELKWDTFFLNLAHAYGMQSKDPSSKVGAVIADDNMQISQGYNGFPKGCLDNKEIYEDRERKYLRVIHAEINAIIHADRPLYGTTLYCTLPPCCQCSAVIIQSGIKRVVTFYPDDEFADRWNNHILESGTMFREAEVQVEMYSKSDVVYEWLNNRTN